MPGGEPVRDAVRTRGVWLGRRGVQLRAPAGRALEFVLDQLGEPADGERLTGGEVVDPGRQPASAASR